MKKLLISLSLILCTAIVVAQVKDTIQVSVSGLKTADVLTLAKAYGYRETIPDPADNTKTIANPVSAKDFLEGHLERQLAETLINASAGAKAETERKAEEERIKGRIDTRLKNATNGVRRQ